MKKTLSLLVPALLASCTAGPDYKGPPTVAAPGARFVRATDPAITNAPGLARWWESLGDPTLTALVDAALAHSPSIDVAAARLRDAQAQLRAQRANGLPTASASATYLHAQLPGTGLGGGDSGGGSDDTSSLDFVNLGGTASWEPDLFGGGRRGTEQARATVGRRFADLADAQVSLTAQVAQAYVSLRDVQARARLNAQSSDLQRRALALTRQLYAAGTASALDVERLQNQLQSTDADNIPLAAQVDDYRDQLAVLTGQVPGALDETLGDAAPVPLPPASVAIGNPADLIAHRPDIRSAERALAAGNAGIGIARARLLPGVRFLGLLGMGGSDLGDLFDPGKLTTLIAPSLNWSVLDFGKARAAVRRSEAQRDEAEAQYRRAVLDALNDAETGLSRFGATRRQLAQLAQAQVSAARASRLNAQRVAAGTSTLIDQLDIQRRELAARIAVAQASAALTGSYIAVQKSLGLGWSDPARPPSG